MVYSTNLAFRLGLLLHRCLLLLLHSSLRRLLLISLRSTHLAVGLAV
jgi:hypothetical protein